MAIHYSETDPEKISRWRKQAARQAWLPNISAGLDRNSGDYRHWDSGPNPDVLLKGKQTLDWDIGVSWNLGELIWNNDQTSIDSRSKLMVELRDDIINQITRLYFERRRLQIEMKKNATGLDESTQIDYTMRIDELTATLDGLTGGKFSRSIE